MAGYWPQSNTQVCDTLTGLPLVGAKLYFYEGGTSTPLTVYTTSQLSTSHTQPIVADSNGMWPAVFFTQEEGAEYRARATKPTGLALFDVSAPIIWQPPASPPEPEFDPTGVCPTGVIVDWTGGSAPAGWLLCNGRTFGSAISGADYASDDNEALFLWLWIAGNLSVVGGRGASAAADWAANKQLTLPDARGRVLAGVDQMGASSPAGRITGGVDLFAVGGSQTAPLTIANLPPHDHTGTTDFGGIHSHVYSKPGVGSPVTGGGGFSASAAPSDANTGDGGNHQHPFTTNSTGSGVEHANLQPYILTYKIIKK